MQAGNIYRIRSVGTVHYLGAAAQNVALAETLDLFAAPATAPTGDLMGIGAGKHVRTRLRELRIISVQNLAWEVWLFGNTPFGGASLPAEKFMGRWQFIAADAVQALGDTFFYYYINGLDLAYQDLANSGKIYTRLVNRSAVAKNAGATGALEVEFGFELLQGR